MMLCLCEHYFKFCEVYLSELAMLSVEILFLVGEIHCKIIVV